MKSGLVLTYRMLLRSTMKCRSHPQQMMKIHLYSRYILVHELVCPVEILLHHVLCDHGLCSHLYTPCSVRKILAVSTVASINFWICLVLLYRTVMNFLVFSTPTVSVMTLPAVLAHLKILEEHPGRTVLKSPHCHVALAAAFE